MKTDEFEELIQKLERKKRNSGIVYALIPIGIILITLLVFGSKILKKRTELNALSAELQFKSDSLKKIESALYSKSLELQRVKSEIARLPANSGDSLKNIFTGEADSDKFSEIKNIRRQTESADVHIQAIIKDDAAALKQYEIFYFQKDIDQAVVIETMKSLGLDMKIMPGRSDLKFIPTNAIYYGSKVDIKHVKLIALALIKAGIDIKELQPFEANRKQNKIEILSDADLINKRPLLVYEIEKM